MGLGKCYDVYDLALECWATMGPLPNLTFYNCIGGLPMQYRRAKTPGATYFFTVVTFRRWKILCEPDNLVLLRTAFKPRSGASLCVTPDVLTVGCVNGVG